ncbi:MAG: substrate-binding periplasmic protein [Gammaproteobacteria bacterium]
MPSLKALYYISFIILIIFDYTKLIFAEEIIVLSATGGPPLNTAKLDGFMDRVIKEAFKRLDIKLETVKLPAERALLNSNNGIIDGEMGRIAGLNRRYTNLVQVKEKIMDWEFVVFSNKNISLNDSWQSLRPYSVAIINGWKILESNVPEVVELTKVKNPKQLFGMLKLKRADLIIYEKWAGIYYLKSKKISDVKLISPPLIVKPLYIYLHKKHKNLTIKLTKTLKNMKKDGTYLKLKSEILKKYN